MRHLPICSMFVLFACAYVTLDHMPRAAERVLRGGAEYMVRVERQFVTDFVR